MKSPRLTRRALAGMAAPVLLSARASAQAPAAPTPISVPNRVQEASRALAAVKLSRTTEPATRFEA